MVNGPIALADEFMMADKTDYMFKSLEPAVSFCWRCGVPPEARGRYNKILLNNSQNILDFLLPREKITEIINIQISIKARK